MFAFLSEGASKKNPLLPPTHLTSAQQIKIEEAGGYSGKEKPYPGFELARFSASRSRAG